MMGCVSRPKKTSVCPDVIEELMAMITFLTAVWWPKDGAYGGSKSFGTLAQAEADVDVLKRLHYGYKHNPIHILKRTSDEIVKVIDDMKEEEK